MKTYYKLHIMSTAPITSEEIENMNMPDFAGRLIVDENFPQVASIIVSVDNSGNPDFDEVSDLILAMDDYGNASVFFGYPKEDMSNAVTDESNTDVWALLDDCKVDFNG